MGELNYLKQPIRRQTNGFQLVGERIKHFNEFTILLDKNEQAKQASRCMDCGVSFCQSGCPIDNKIPDFNKAVEEGRWSVAYNILSETNNFPEFTGRLCPAPCESSCVLGINNEAVTIKNIEQQIIEYAFDNDLVELVVKQYPTHKNIAVIGSGPAGLAAADELNKLGHNVTVYEKNDAIGGLLRYGIPDFKIERQIIDRRIDLMKKQGINFLTSMNIGEAIPTADLVAQFDAVVLTCGSSVPRDIKVAGRNIHGIHFAMDYLEQSNRLVQNENSIKKELIDVKNKNIVVIGGGDTGADCVGVSIREGAKAVMQIEVLGKPSLSRHPETPWPLWPDQLRISTSHQEGCQREWALSTKDFVGNDKGELIGLNVVQVEWQKNNSGFRELVNTEKFIPCDIVLIAAGFLYPNKNGPIEDLDLALDRRGNVETNNYLTSHSNVFAAGDMRMGQSLIVWAIAEGRKVAKAVNNYILNKPTTANLYSKI